MSKLSLHLQSCPAWVPQFIERSGVEWIKWIDPPEIDPGWGVKVIGRTYEPDGVSNDRVWQGANGAKSWFNEWLPFYASRPWVHCWEGPNEPQPMGNAQFRASLNIFTVELARLMHNAGLKLVGMNWGVGWPDINQAREMGEGVQACDYLGLHEYSAPHMWDDEGWLCLRYGRAVAELKAAGYTVPPLIIGECGIDGGVIGQPRTGWRTHCDGDFDRYLQQLKWYSQELDRGDNVAAATIFTVCDWDWRDFAIDEAQALPLADWIASDQDDDDDNGNGEETDMDVKVFDVTGAEQSWDWLIDKYGAVNIQKPDADSYFKITEIRERHDDSTFIVKVLNADGTPKTGKTVLFWYSTAPVAPGSGWMERGDPGRANENGDAGFAMGSGAWYSPPGGGPHSAYLFGTNVSEMIEGIGMVMGPDGPTNHNHVNITYQYVEDGDDPEPLPIDGDLAEVVEQLTRIADSLEALTDYVTR